MSAGPLAGRTLFISGGSRGIGLAIALRAARDGANIALIAKTAEPHPKLEGTVFTAAEQIEEAGGRALPIVGDIRDDQQVFAAVEQAVERFGGIDACVNNASAINLAGTEALEMKRYDLMQSINTRGTFLVSKACVPHLKRSENPHVLTLSPPLNMDPKWFKGHVGYTIAKYGMSMCTIGMAEEFRDDGIAFNALWPRTIIATAAVQNLLGGEEAMARSRRPELVADAAHAILARPSRECPAPSAQAPPRPHIGCAVDHDCHEQLHKRSGQASLGRCPCTRASCGIRAWPACTRRRSSPACRSASTGSPRSSSCVSRRGRSPCREPSPAASRSASGSARPSWRGSWTGSEPGCFSASPPGTLRASLPCWASVTRTLRRRR
jgi:citronellol/citronellal dehydrogenase